LSTNRKWLYMLLYIYFPFITLIMWKIGS